MLQTQPGSDISPGSDLSLKLDVSDGFFAAYQGCGTTFASHILQTNKSVPNFCSKATRSSTFICSLLKIRNYFPKLLITNQTGTSMRNLSFGDTHLSMFFESD